MLSLFDLFAGSAGLLGMAGLAQAMIGAMALWRFSRTRKIPLMNAPPPVTVLKPLHGDEPLLEQALATFCAQDYPHHQIVFGVHDKADPALQTIERLRKRFPNVRIDIVVDSTQHGSNRKISNLINMMRVARHDLLVMSDSDIHVEPDYLRHVVTALDKPCTGLVTTLYAGLPANDTQVARFGASQINHSFLPGVVMARGLGRQACLGATMALHRKTLHKVGGLAAVAHQVADDAILGTLVNQKGLQVDLAPTLTSTTVPETKARDLFHHELRWARTTRALAPLPYAMSSLQYPLFWGLLAMMFSGFQTWSIVLFFVLWAGKAAAAFGIDRMLRLAPSTPIWLLPIRDLVSIAVILLSFVSDDVRWRGEAMTVSRPHLAPGKGY